MKSILAIPDMHLPFHSRRALLELYEVIKRRKPSYLVQLGDFYDLYSWSKFPRSHNLCTPLQEIKNARKSGEVFWRMVRQLAPKAQCVMLRGNHDSRAVKRALEKAPELEEWTSKGIDALLTFDGVETLGDSRDVIVIEDIAFHHGYLLQPGAHARVFGKNTVVGHTHRGGVATLNIGDKTIWELNAGYLGNRFTLPMSYSQQRRFCNWSLGYGFIDADGPSFCPLNVRLRG